MKFANNIVLPIILMIMVISGAVTFTVFFTPLYYLDVKILDIPGQSGYSLDLISRNYDTLINYMSVFNHGELAFPDLAMSPMGKIHFEEVRDIFQNVKILTIICGVISVVGGILQIRKKDFKFLRNASILIVIMPVLLAIPIAINFNACFIMFHKIMFSNNYWIFNPVLDPVINILPEAFFMHMGIAILGIMVCASVILQLIYHKVKKLNHGNIKIKN